MRPRSPRLRQLTMTHTAPAFLTPLRILALFLLLALPIADCGLRIAEASNALEPLRITQADQTLTTKYFTITYPAGEEKTANWYAGFADEVDAAVSELLGAEPVQNLSLHIFATEEEYTQA